MQLNSYWMGFLIRREWQFENFSDSDHMFESIPRLYSAYSALRRTWNGDGSSVAAGKNQFSPEFVRFVDARLPGKTEP